MEERKQKEIAYYDEQAVREVVRQEDYSPMLGSHKFLYAVAGSLCDGKRVLDYGCGEGIHIPFLARHASEVDGIDLSEGALAIARKHARQEGIGEDKVKFLVMDCEKLEFPEHSFDVVFDGGTFSSLDFGKAMVEITRVLRPDGVLVGIETFGHNPLANAKRALNRVTGKRTSWAASHIVTQRELAILKNHFADCRFFYFHLVSLFVFPLLNLPGGSVVLRFLEGVDRMFLCLPFLQKYTFKVVFVCKGPRQDIKIT